MDPSMDAAVSRGSKPTRGWGLTGKAQTPKQILGVTWALNPTVVWDPQADLAPVKCLDPTDGRGPTGKAWIPEQIWTPQVIWDP